MVYDLIYDQQYSGQGSKSIILLLESYISMANWFDHTVSAFKLPTLEGLNWLFKIHAYWCSHVWSICLSTESEII